MKIWYEVKDDFTNRKLYQEKIRPQYARLLSTLTIGQVVNQKQFIEEHIDEFTRKKGLSTTADVVRHAFMVGRKIGMLKLVSDQKNGIPISYDEFCKLETVSYFMNQHRESKYKHLEPPSDAGTAHSYGYRLWNFNNWLYDKEFEFTRIENLGNDTYKTKKEIVKLEGLEHFLKLYQDTFSQEREFVRIIKKFLMDPIHQKLRANTVKIVYNAIKSYFEKNESSLHFRYDYKARHKTVEEDNQEAILTIEELMMLLTEGRPTITQKAAFLCKFHRGLDTVTLCDRFNFEAWSQIVSWFETEDHKRWDLSKCPVPIRLTRLKTSYNHVGFLERDAIISIQKYLDFRHDITGRLMTEDQALFLTQRKKPIGENWVRFTMRRLCKNASLNDLLKEYEVKNRFKRNSHEFRDLLKSTLLDCGVRWDVAEQCIGHKPKDSYEKQFKLYAENLRREYSKASKKLNVFTNFSNVVLGVDDIEMHNTMNEMRLELAKVTKRQQRTEGLLLKT